MVRFPELADKVVTSVGLGRHLLWSPDGRTVFFSTPDGMRAVPVEPGARLRADSGEVVFTGEYFDVDTVRQYDLSPDGLQFLTFRDKGMTTGTRPELILVILVQNWHQELLERVPIP